MNNKNMKIMVAIILSAIALVVGFIALAIALKKQTMKVLKETKTIIEHVPVDHPFIYDAQRGIYTLDGNLKVNGTLSCLEKEEQ